MRKRFMAKAASFRKHPSVGTADISPVRGDYDTHPCLP